MFHDESQESALTPAVRYWADLFSHLLKTFGSKLSPSDSSDCDIVVPVCMGKVNEQFGTFDCETDPIVRRTPALTFIALYRFALVKAFLKVLSVDKGKKLSTVAVLAGNEGNSFYFIDKTIFNNCCSLGEKGEEHRDLNFRLNGNFHSLLQRLEKEMVKAVINLGEYAFGSKDGKSFRAAKGWKKAEEGEQYQYIPKAVDQSYALFSLPGDKQQIVNIKSLERSAVYWLLKQGCTLRPCGDLRGNHQQDACETKGSTQSPLTQESIKQLQAELKLSENFLYIGPTLYQNLLVVSFAWNTFDRSDNCLVIYDSLAHQGQPSLFPNKSTTTTATTTTSVSHMPPSTIAKH